MHDIDKTLQEIDEYIDTETDFDSELEFGLGLGEEFESEYEFEGELEYDDSEFEFEGEFEYEDDSLINEEEEISLASELLAITNDQELEYFLGKLFRKLRKSKVFRKVGRFFKKVAKKVIPIAGGALGTFFGGPLGGALGGKMGRLASSLFEIDPHGMEEEELEFEVAKKYVRFAKATSNALSRIPASKMNNKVLNSVMRKVASKYAPGLTRRRSSSRRYGSQIKSGKWYRRGNTIVLKSI